MADGARRRPDLERVLDRRVGRQPTLRRLRELARDVGARLWWVGGGVRDAALRRASHDVDLIVTERSRRLRAAIRDRWGTDGFSFRKRGVTTWRFVLGGAPVDLVVAERRGIDADLERRELTVNAIALSLNDGRLHDPLNGLGDLVRRRLRAPHPDRFREDPVRALRLARFVAALPGFRPTAGTRRAAASVADRLAGASPERLLEELGKLLTARRPHDGLDALREGSLLAAVLPEMLPTLDCVAGEDRPDVWSHTVAVVRESTRRGLPGADRLDADGWRVLRFGMLLHDVAKPATLARAADGRPTFHGHETLGARAADRCLARLRAPRGLRRDVARLVRWHLRPGHLADGPRTDRGLRRLAHDAGPLLPHLCIHALADARGSGTPDPEPRLARLEATVRALLATGDALAARPARRPVDGRDVMRICRVGPGREVGRILRELDERVLDGRIEGRADALEWLRTR